MPQILLFAPCRQAIVDRDNQSLSLIGIINGMNISVSSGEAIPDNAIAPVEWAIVSVWLLQPGEENKTFEQKIDLSFSDGKSFPSQTLLFKMVGRVHQVYAKSNAFPVGTPGDCTFTLFVREVREEGPEQEWQKKAEYCIEIKHTLP